MKSKKIILILLAVLVLLSICYFAIKKHQDEEAKDSTATITSLKNLDPTQFSYQNKENSYTFVLKDSTWSSNNAQNCNLQQKVITGFLSELSDLKAERVLKNPDSLSDYGLDSPQYTVTLNQKSKNLTLSFSTLNSVNYLFVSGDTSVYVLSEIPAELDYNIIKWIDTPYLPYVKKNNITELTYNGYTLVRENSSKTSDDKSQDTNDSSDSDENTTSMWKITTPSGTTETKETDKISTLLTSVYNLYLTDCVDFNVTDTEKLASYGLANPAYSFTLSYTDSDTGESKSYTLDIGNNASDDSTYVMMDHSGYISLLSQDEAKTLENALTAFSKSIT